MVKKNYFLLFFFIFLSIFSLTKLFDNSINLDAWEYGEWLINYQYGFVRRGFFGEVIYQLSSVLNNNIQISDINVNMNDSTIFTFAKNAKKKKCLLVSISLI